MFVWLFNVVLLNCVSSFIHHHKFKLLVTDFPLMATSSTILALPWGVVIEL